MITLVSGGAELTLLSALLHYNSFFECLSLRRSSFLSVNRHRRRVTALSFLALLLFVALEILVSFFSDPAFRILPQHRSCLVMRPIVPQEKALKGRKKSRIISLGCVTTTQRFESQHVGNLSLSDNQVQCAKQAAYRFTLGERDIHTLLLPPHAEFGCSNEQDRIFCAFAFQQDNQVFVSPSVYGLDAPDITSGRYKLNYTRTEVFFNTSGLLRTISIRAAVAYSKFITDPADLRLEIFTATEQTSCSFGVKSEATEVALGALLAIATMWTISFCSFLGSIPFRSRVFYDMRNPLHWARKTTRDLELPPVSDPVVIKEHQKEGTLVYLQNASTVENEYVNVQ